jgi:two-component system, cell cycle response regulator
MKMYMGTGCGKEYGNCKNADALSWLSGTQRCETGSLQRELAVLVFLTSFAREVGGSLNSREVVLAAAKSLHNYFQYDLAVFSLPTDLGGVTAFSPLDAAGRMSGFLMARESFPTLRLRKINGYRHLGLADPCQASDSGNCPTVVEIAGGSVNITLYCGEEGDQKATHYLLTGIAESLTTALRNAREHDRVKELSVRDSLTGLYNRRVLEEILIVEESKRTPAPLAILLIDVDDFKVINDTFGHPAGDRVLSVLGKLLQDNCRRENIVARYGGEEFAVLLTNTGLTKTAALEAAERLRYALGAQDFAFSGRKVRLTVSIGVAYSAGKTAIPETMLARADQALYQAKRSGKNRVCMYEAKHIKLMPAKSSRPAELHVSL